MNNRVMDFFEIVDRGNKGEILEIAVATRNGKLLWSLLDSCNGDYSEIDLNKLVDGVLSMGSLDDCAKLINSNILDKENLDRFVNAIIEKNSKNNISWLKTLFDEVTVVEVSTKLLKALLKIKYYDFGSQVIAAISEKHINPEDIYEEVIKYGNGGIVLEYSSLEGVMEKHKDEITKAIIKSKDAKAMAIFMERNQDVDRALLTKELLKTKHYIEITTFAKGNACHDVSLVFDMLAKDGKYDYLTELVLYKATDYLDNLVNLILGTNDRETIVSFGINYLCYLWDKDRNDYFATRFHDINQRLIEALGHELSSLDIFSMTKFRRYIDLAMKLGYNVDDLIKSIASYDVIEGYKLYNEYPNLKVFKEIDLMELAIKNGDWDFVVDHKDEYKIDTDLLTDELIGNASSYEIAGVLEKIPGLDVPRLQKIFLDCCDPDEIKDFALSVEGADIPSLEDALINEGSGLEIIDFMEHVPGANIDKLADAVIKSEPGYMLDLANSELVINNERIMIMTKIKNRIIELKNARLAVGFAESFAKDEDIPKLEGVVIGEYKTNYIVRFAKNVSGANIRRLEEAMLKCYNVDNMLEFATIPGVDIAKIEDWFIKNSDIEHMKSFFGSVKGLNVAKFMDVLEEEHTFDNLLAALTLVFAQDVPDVKAMLLRIIKGWGLQNLLDGLMYLKDKNIFKEIIKYCNDIIDIALYVVENYKDPLYNDLKEKTKDNIELDYQFSKIVTYISAIFGTLADMSKFLPVIDKYGSIERRIFFYSIYGVGDLVKLQDDIIASNDTKLVGMYSQEFIKGEVDMIRDAHFIKGVYHLLKKGDKENLAKITGVCYREEAFAKTVGKLNIDPNFDLFEAMYNDKEKGLMDLPYVGEVLGIKSHQIMGLYKLPSLNESNDLASEARKNGSIDAFVCDMVEYGVDDKYIDPIIEKYYLEEDQEIIGRPKMKIKDDKNAK